MKNKKTWLEHCQQRYTLYPYKGEMLLPKQIHELVKNKVDYNTLCSRLQRGWSTEDSIYGKPKISKHAKSIREYKKYPYKGKMYMLRELNMLPDCEVGYETLKSRIISLGWTVERAMKGTSNNQATHEYKPQKCNQETERIKAIMAKPIALNATSYYYVNCRDKETKYKMEGLK